jgi:hypothetical protein
LLAHAVPLYSCFLLANGIGLSGWVRRPFWPTATSDDQCLF